MTHILQRRSPIQHLFDPSVGQWGKLAQADILLALDSEEIETRALQTLALCDLSLLPKLGVKGPAAANWLQSQGQILPEGIYQTRTQPSGSLILQLSDNEFLLQDSLTSETVQPLAEKLGWGQEDVVLVERQEATFLLTGSRTLKVWAQTCAIDFRTTPHDRLVMTRVAGISCSILPTGPETAARYQIWVDATYAVSLWQSLLTICQELEGRAIGTAVFSAHGTSG